MDLTFKNSAIITLAENIHSLSGDLRRIQSGIGPTFEDRASAPAIEDWEIGWRFELALTGRVSGHPRLGDGLVVTSPLFILDEDRRFARTQNRYYLLGRRRRP